MIRRLCAILLCLLLCGCAAGGSVPQGAYTFTDDTGAVLSVDHLPKKVAVLTSSLADLWLCAGGSVDITVGETEERGLIQKNTAVLVDSGAGKTVNTELLIAQKPDLVLYSSDLSGQAEAARLLRAAGIAAAGFRLETFGDYLRLLKICTDILQNPTAYETHGLSQQAEIARLTALAQAQPQQPKVLFVRAGSDARYTKAKTAENHFACAMLKELGTENIAEAAPILLDGLSLEHILLSDPDAVFFTTMGDESAGTAYMESLLADPAWSALKAVRNDRVHQLPKALFQYKPNGRWAEAYAYLIALLYGDIL